jgi:hypothetical protein
MQSILALSTCKAHGTPVFPTLHAPMQFFLSAQRVSQRLKDRLFSKAVPVQTFSHSRGIEQAQQSMIARNDRQLVSFELLKLQ